MLKKLISLSAGLTLLTSSAFNSTAFADQQTTTQHTVNFQNIQKTNHFNLKNNEQVPFVSNQRNFLIAANGTIYVLYPSGLYSSTDGTKFSKIQGLPAFPPTGGGNATILQAANKTIYLYYSQGLFYSKDGVHFARIKNVIPTFDIKDTTMIQSRNGTIYLIGNYGLYQSTDGMTFSQNKSFPSLAHANGAYSSMFQANNGNIYITSQYNLYQSTDGSTFTINKSVPTLSGTAQYGAMIQSRNGTIYLGASNGLYESQNGTTFSQNKTLYNFAVTSLYQTTNQTVYVGTSGRGLYQAPDGINFKPNTSLPGVIGNVNVITQSNTTKTVYIATAEGLFQAKNGTTFKQNRTILPGIPADDVYVGKGKNVYLELEDSDFQTQTVTYGFFQAPDGKNFVFNPTIPRYVIHWA